MRSPRATWTVVCGAWLPVLVALAGGLAIALVIKSVEHPWQENTLEVAPGTAAHILASYASWWGKLDNGLSVVLLGWLAFGIIARHKCSQVAVVTILWAQLIAGLMANLGKAGLGRARPSAGVMDGFYGPSLDHALQSFPSGHTTAAFAFGVALAGLRPQWAPVGLAYAGLVGWSRLALFVHHPSDVAMGAVLGSVVALVCVRAGRELGAIPRAATLPVPPR